METNKKRNSKEGLKYRQQGEFQLISTKAPRRMQRVGWEAGKQRKTSNQIHKTNLVTGKNRLRAIKPKHSGGGGR